jgi:hypothetical protein
VTGTIGYMAAFIEERPRSSAAMSYIRNTTIGGDTPYVYVTRRAYDRPEGTATLTCMGGPEHPIDGPWVRDQDFPGEVLSYMDEHIRPFAQPARPPGRPYDFQWRGLMGYMDGMVRVIGPTRAILRSCTTSVATASVSCRRSAAASVSPASSPGSGCRRASSIRVDAMQGGAFRHHID